MQPNDWDKEYIKYRLKKQGYSLRQLSILSRLAPTTLSNVFRFSYPKAERIIAFAIGVEVNDIWPSRYNTTKNHPK